MNIDIEWKLFILALLIKRAKEKQEKIGNRPVPEGIMASIMFEFFDPKSNHPDRPHGVCAFVLKEGDSIDNYEKDLWGPYGFSSETDVLGIHLYGRDTWGIIEYYQIEANPLLQLLINQYPDEKVTIVLAGVRMPLQSIYGEPSNFILVRKKSL